MRRQYSHLTEVTSLLIHEVNESARSSHHHLHTFLQILDLLPLGNTSVHTGAADTTAGSCNRKYFNDIQKFKNYLTPLLTCLLQDHLGLHGQFSGWSNDQHHGTTFLPLPLTLHSVFQMSQS